MADLAKFASPASAGRPWSCVVVVGQFAAHRRGRIGLSEGLSQSCLIDDEHALPGTGELLRCGAGCIGNLESVRARTSTHIESVAALRQFVKLQGRREFDVSLGSDGGRRIFSEITPSDECEREMRADAKISDLGEPRDVITRLPAVPWHIELRKTPKIHTTGRPLVVPERE